METVTIRYEKLFSILLAHSDFPAPTAGKAWAASLKDGLKIKPDGPTAKLFERHDIRCQFEYNTLSCYIRVTTDRDVPFFRLPTDFSVRFLLTATNTIINKTNLPASFGGEHTYHVRVKLKATTASSRLTNAPLGKVTSTTPQLVFHPGYTENPSFWEKRPVAIVGCLAVLDIVTEGTNKNRLFKQEATQELNYTVSNHKSDQHLYQINLKV